MFASVCLCAQTALSPIWVWRGLTLGAGVTMLVSTHHLGWLLWAPNASMQVVVLKAGLL